MTRLQFDYADENDNYSNNNIPMQRISNTNRNGSRSRNGNGRNEKGGRLGIRKKLKKVSKDLVCSNNNKNDNYCHRNNYNDNKNNIYNYNNNSIDIDSEVDLVSIDLRTPPTTPSPIQGDRNATSKSVAAATEAAQKKNAATAARTISMMTPDMLETLGLTEVTMNNINTNTTDIRQYTRAYTTPPPRPRPTNTSTHSWNAPTKKSVRIDENRNTIQQSLSAIPPQPREENHHRYGCGFGYNQNTNGNKHKHKRAHNLNQSCDTFDGDNGNTRSTSFSTSSSGSSSSNDSYEPIPRAPDDCDWTIEDTSADEYSDDNNTLLQYYKKASRGDCNIGSCLGMVFALPVACGLLCLDNLVDTGFFGTSSQQKKNKTKSPSKSLPEVLVPRGNAAEQSSSNSNNNKTRTKSKTTTATNSNNTNNNDKKKSQQKSSHRGRSKNDDDDDSKSIRDGSNCELFPSSIELPFNKIIAPCW